MKFRPKKARGEEHTLIVYQHLLFQYRRQKWIDDGYKYADIPLQEFLWVEGLDGVGKTFIIQLMRNITRNIEGRNSSDLTSAPTGCAAKILSAKTHCRSSDVPTGTKLTKTPANDSTMNLERSQEMRKVMTDVVV